MAKLTTIEKQILEKLFQMGSGYVLNFSDRTMRSFFQDDLGINIYSPKYEYLGGSKANRLRSFWQNEDEYLVGKTTLAMIEYIEGQLLIDGLLAKDFPTNRIEAARKIANRLICQVTAKNIQERVIKNLKDDNLWVRTTLEGKDLHISIGERKDGKGDHVHLISDSDTGEMRIHGSDKAPGELLKRVVSITTKEGKTIEASQQQVKTTLEFLETDKENKSDQFKGWIVEKRTAAKGGIDSLGINTSMEITCEIGSDNDFPLSQIRDSARDSTIPYFGWPIAAFLDHEDFAPKPDSNGIFAEIIVDREGSESYDYWAIDKYGNFYLLKSLFEDKRKPGKIFFDTRIIRITESLLYLKNLYKKLGFANSKKLVITIKHAGIKGRVIDSAGNRNIFSNYVSSVDEVETKVTTTLDEIDNNIEKVVDKFTKPLFEKFSFFELQTSILEDIVMNYTKGKIV